MAYPCGFGFCKGGTFFSSVLHFEILGQNATAMTAILRQLLAAILSVAIAVPAFSSSCSVGNRTSKTSTLPGMPGTTSSYNANDQLASDTYDNDGNTTASNGKGYSYDFENHLVQQAGITVVYDGDGNRVAKTTANGTSQYLVDDLNPTGYAQVLDEVQSGAAVRTYTWGLELISAHQSINSTPTTSYYVFDGHGSVRALTNASGADTDTYDYDAFGNLIHSSTTLALSTPNNYLFAGEQFDPDLGLYYNRARYLNTSTGRFWSIDRYEGNDESPLSLHKYLYAQGNPVDNADPSGNQVDELIGMAVESVLDTIYPVNPMPTIAAASRAATTISQRGMRFTEYEETGKTTPDRFPYDDGGRPGVGNCTIGWGHLLEHRPCSQADHDAFPTPLSDAAADQYFFSDVQDALRAVHTYVKVSLAQKEFDVMTDFTFNAGAGSLQRSQVLTLLNESLYSAVAIALPFQNIRPGSTVERGLSNRRADEAFLWTTGIYRAHGVVIN